MQLRLAASAVRLADASLVALQANNGLQGGHEMALLERADRGQATTITDAAAVAFESSSQRSLGSNEQRPPVGRRCFSATSHVAGDSVA